MTLHTAAVVAVAMLSTWSLSDGRFRLRRAVRLLSCGPVVQAKMLGTASLFSVLRVDL